MPSPLSVRTEEYQPSRRLYLECAAAPGNLLVAKFLRFVEGNADQAIVARVGFVDQTAAPVPREALQAALSAPARGPAPTPRPASEYDRLVRGAERVGLNLRFTAGATGVDNKGLADVERLLRRLARPELRRRSVALLGFADNRGASDVNLRVSEERARAVAALLQQRGLRAVTARGLGAENPVSSNDSADGRAKNRRVEIGLSPQG